jgi:HD-GYP domain-containing protein (c-di-GMP phosphodiesterase class II)
MRASDIVKGKMKVFENGNGANGSNQPLPSPEEKTLSGERGSLRLSEIEIMNLKARSTPGEGTGGTSITDGFERRFSPISSGRALASEDESALPAHEGAAMRKIYLAAKEYMVMVRRSIQAGKSFPLEPALVYVNNILNSSVDVTSQIYQLTVDYEREDDYYLSSPVNVMVYGLKVAQGMGCEKAHLIELGLAALLHDVGMFLVPDAVLNKEGKLTDEEMDMIRKHPETAVEILSEHRDAYPKMLRAIYEHQERANGQGYPRGLKGGEICDYAQIIGICDSYESMTHHRPHKKPLPQTDSMKELIGARGNLFAPRVTKAFLDEISIFPVGSYVRMNNRNIGRVVATNRGAPMKPVLKLISDEKGRRIDPARIIDLRNYPILNIELSVSPDEISA